MRSTRRRTDSKACNAWRARERGAILFGCLGLEGSVVREETSFHEGQLTARRIGVHGIRRLGHSLFALTSHLHPTRQTENKSQCMYQLPYHRTKIDKQKTYSSSAFLLKSRAVLLRARPSKFFSRTLKNTEPSSAIGIGTKRTFQYTLRWDQLYKERQSRLTKPVRINRGDTHHVLLARHDDCEG